MIALTKLLLMILTAFNRKNRCFESLKLKDLITRSVNMDFAKNIFARSLILALKSRFFAIVFAKSVFTSIQRFM